MRRCFSEFWENRNVRTGILGMSYQAADSSAQNPWSRHMPVKCKSSAFARVGVVFDPTKVLPRLLENSAEQSLVKMSDFVKLSIALFAPFPRISIQGHGRSVQDPRLGDLSVKFLSLHCFYKCPLNDLKLMELYILCPFSLFSLSHICGYSNVL